MNRGSPRCGPGGKSSERCFNEAPIHESGKSSSPQQITFPQERLQ